MVTKTTIGIGILTLILLSTGIVYVEFKNDARLRVDQSYTTFYVPHENMSWIWVVSGREQNKLYNGSTLMLRDTQKITINTTYDSNKIVIKRVTPYLKGATIIDTYLFDGSLDSISLFPISHTVEVFNAKGMFYRYDVSKLTYSGETFKLDGLQQEMSFGKRMTVTWWKDYASGWVYKSGSMYVKSKKLESDYERFDVRLFDPDPCYTTLYLNGINDTRKYELETPITFEAMTYWSNGSFYNVTNYINVNHTDAVLFSNYTEAGGINRNVTYIFTPLRLLVNKFNVSYTNLNITPDNSTYFLIDNLSYPDGGNFSIFGHYNNSLLPKNVTLFMGNLTTPLEQLPGTLNGSILIQDTLSTGEISKNITFTSAGSTTVYVNLSRAGKSNGNITIQIAGYSLDKGNNFDLHEFYNGTENIWLVSPSVNASNFWMWDASFRNITEYWTTDTTGTAAYHGANISFRKWTTTSYSTCTGSDCYQDDTDSGSQITVNFDAEESSRVMFKIRCNGYDTSGSGACGGGGTWWRTEQSYCNYYLKGTSEQAIDSTIMADQTSVYELRKVNDTLGTWYVYDDGVYETTITLNEEDLELKFKTSSRATAQNGGCPGGTTTNAAAAGDVYLYYINSSGLGNQWNGSNYLYNATIKSKVIFSAPNPISRVYMNAEDSKPTGTYITYEVSNNNGTNWQSINDDSFTLFTSIGNNLTYRVNITSNFTNITARVRNVIFSVIPSPIQNVSVDFNDDGTDDWNYVGELNNTNSPQNISLNFTASQVSLFKSNLGSALSGLFPIKFSVDSLGLLEIRSLYFPSNVSVIQLNNTYINQALKCSGICKVNISSKQTNGQLELSNLKAYYKGRANFTARANSSDILCTVDNKVVQAYYSKINASFPTKVLFYDVFPESVNSTSVSPYGQKAQINNPNSTGIFTVSGDKPFDWNYSIYESFTPAVDSCLKLQSCSQWNKTSCILTNTSLQLMIYNVSSTATNKIFHWWNLTNCPSQLYLNVNITHSPYCLGCVITE